MSQDLKEDQILELKSEGAQENPSSEIPFGERILFLFDQLTLTSEIYLEAMAPILELLKTGRAPRQLPLEASLVKPQEYAKILQEIFQDLEQAFNSFSEEMALIKKTQFWPIFSQEFVFWREFTHNAFTLTKKIVLYAPQEQSSALTLKTLQESWRELLRLAEDASS